MPISEDALEEFQAAHQKLTDFLQKEMAGFDYHIIFSFSKSKTNEKGIDFLAGTVSSLTGWTAWITIKTHLGAVLSHTQHFLNDYNQLPIGKPLFGQTENKDDKK